MTKAYSNGIEKLVGNKLSDKDRQINLYEKTWKELRSKLDSLLIGTNVLKGDAVRKMCQSLDSMNQDERYNHILKNWGSLYAEKSRPLLNQLQTIELQINALEKTTGGK